MKWNPNDWQGKRKDQVENNYVGLYIVVMILTFLAIIFLFSSCSSANACYVQRSSVVITDEKENVIYIKNTDVGHMIYNHWVRGTYGNDYRPVLVNDSTFNNLSKRID